MAKLQNLNAHYMKERDNQSLLDYIAPFIGQDLDQSQKQRILSGMNSLKERAKTILDLVDSIQVYIKAPEAFDDACAKYATPAHLEWLRKVIGLIEGMNPIVEQELCASVKDLAKENGTKLVEIAQAIRGALCGKLVSPSVFEIIEILGADESISRIRKFIDHFA